MSRKFNEYKNFDLSDINKEVLKRWQNDKTFEKSIKTREGNQTYVFYEGPPSANGIPGIHHVMARAIKDIFCRYKTLKGYQVHRKAGWDTHGLPVELGVEKALGITKEDIGKTISVEQYNNACKKDVMKYTGLWENLTDIMGYWVDMNDPYITYDNRYIETLWFLLKDFYNKGLLYEGYTIQPYSPAAGTGLSTHELNQPGCYKDVKDTTAVAQFIVKKDKQSDFLFENDNEDLRILAWTTTPWTLPSNTALAVGAKINYLKVKTYNQYTGKPVTVILAKDRLEAFFPAKNAELKMDEFKEGDKKIPFVVTGEYPGAKLAGISYEQLIPWVRPKGDAFRVVTADFVTTEDGTGVVHIAPTFGADDFKTGKDNNITGLLVDTTDNTISPLVDKQGRMIPIENMDKKFVQDFVNVEIYKPFSGRFVKNEYDSNAAPDATTLDIDIAIMLKQENKAFKVEKYEHSYPHCWRTDKPVLYYPLDSWFIKTTAVKDRMIELNNTINWKPQSTGTGRFGKWLENLVDWNLSRSRYWGTPLPIWVTEDRSEMKCIGSVEELKNEIQKSVEAGFMKENPLKSFVPGDNSLENYEQINLHRPFVDEVFLASSTGKKMIRETDLIDVWFDSGAMPYAQLHYPFENKEMVENKTFFPADFIAEGVDQTRGWFFTLHAIATMYSDSVAYKNIISNGLVLDKNGNKMSKRLGNAVDPFTTMEKYGADPLRWYMITNAQPWDNLKFDLEGVDEVKRKFFGTLYNTYSFFSLYANVDGFTYAEEEVPVNERPEIDRWIISLLNSLIKEVEEHYENYEPTKAGRAIQNFVLENLSNWYVRLNRKRFWGGSYSKDKIAAYQTLYTCLETVALLSSPIIPFYADKLYIDLNEVSGKNKFSSVHLAEFVKFNEKFIDKQLEERMDIAQKISSMILGLRRKVNLKVRQPLSKIMVPILDNNFAAQLKEVSNLIISEVNVKEIEYLTETAGILIKKIKPDFKVLGPKYGKQMKEIAAAIGAFSQTDISTLEKEKVFAIETSTGKIDITTEDVEINSEDIPGWLVANEGKYTVALDITVTEELRQEGIAREFINRIQNIRKDSNFDVTDKIHIKIQKHDAINNAIENYKDYISSQTLAVSIILSDKLEQNNSRYVEVDNDITTYIEITKM
ncbi:MAG: isoleucine--tRNA ligase [Bacteroidetes bacterium GWF2_38_335]|nr:MAG: isoleucine--tRNA ligase [Bacteroidetes bacterium GWF2_38_335]OFY79357.1 MAG: isoleucine--tRNA ligase [Bacteroidetes bacterium RIFOXYA12_FULL_38_20]HBS85617.1 isoleucine--tRNA ligase [Bacteroidales bacterium]